MVQIESFVLLEKEVAMSTPKPLRQWTAQLRSHFATVLSEPQIQVLALYSFGLFLARRCGLSTVIVFLAVDLRVQVNTIRQRLKEFYKPAEKKAGTKRQQLDVTLCFAALLRWITGSLQDHRLVLALDPTNLTSKFHVLTISVVYRSVAIPVAWKVIQAEQKGSWNTHWKALLDKLKGFLDETWQVLVLSDRGLESAELFEHIVGVGWHPIMRVKAQGMFRPKGWKKFYPMGRFVRRVGRRCKYTGTAYKTSNRPLPCTFLGCWSEGHEQPWLILTDLSPCVVEPGWYQFRTWIEQGFKIFKREAWQWNRTRMNDPERAERLWLVLSVATLYVVAIGTWGEDVGARDWLPKLRVDSDGTTERVHRVFLVGLALLLTLWLTGQDVPEVGFAPEPWPKIRHQCDNLDEEEFEETEKTYP